MIARLFFLLFCAIGLICTPSQAQLYIEQAKVNLQVAGGEHLNGSLLVHNTSADPLSIKVYWEDFEYKAPYDGTKNFLPAGTAPGSANQWVTFSPQVFTIPGFAQQNIDYSVAIPNGIQEGHYGVLFFERSSLGKINNDEVNLVTRIGTLFFIEPTKKNKSAVIQDISIKGNGLSATFVNQGNVILIPHTTFYIMQNGGLVFERGDSKKLYVPMGVSAPLNIVFKDKLKPGQYTVVINSDLDEGDVVVKEVALTVDDGGQITIGNSQG